MDELLRFARAEKTAITLGYFEDILQKDINRRYRIRKPALIKELARKTKTMLRQLLSIFRLTFSAKPRQNETQSTVGHDGGDIDGAGVNLEWGYKDLR